MTVNTTDIISGPYIGNGVADTFNYDFRIEKKSQLQIAETDTAGVETILTVDTDYTVAGIGTDGGGTVTRVAGALPSGYEWYIRSNYQPTQEADYDSQGEFKPSFHEAVVDKLTFLVQQLADRLSRTLRLGDFVDLTGLDLQLPAPEGGKYIGWNSTANGLVNHDSAAGLVGAAYLDEEQTATAGQTVFTLTGFTYTPGLRNLAVYINGVRQHPSDYTETDTVTVTFPSPGLDAGDEVLFVSADLVTNTTTPASGVSYSNATSGLTAQNAQAAIDEVEGRVDTLETADSQNIKQGTHMFPVPAKAFDATTTNGATAATEELATNDVMINAYDFDAATNQHIQVAIGMPKSWDEGTIQVAFRWKDNGTAGSGNVIWGCKALSVGDDDALDAAWGTAKEVTDTFLASNDLHISSYTAAITPSGTPAAEDDLILDIYRNAADGGDTYTQPARLIGIRVLYTVSAATDA